MILEHFDKAVLKRDLGSRFIAKRGFKAPSSHAIGSPERAQVAHVSETCHPIRCDIKYGPLRDI